MIFRQWVLGSVALGLLVQIAAAQDSHVGKQMWTEADKTVVSDQIKDRKMIKDMQVVAMRYRAKYQKKSLVLDEKLCQTAQNPLSKTHTKSFLAKLTRTGVCPVSQSNMLSISAIYNHQLRCCLVRKHHVRLEYRASAVSTANTQISVWHALNTLWINNLATCSAQFISRFSHALPFCLGWKISSLYSTILRPFGT